MAEAGQDEEEHTFPLKRKPQDIPAEEEAIEKSHQDDDVNKKKKLSTTDENKLEDDDEEEEDYEGEDEEDDDEEEKEDDEQSNGEAEVDRKGKGILRDDKGKGKLIEEEYDSSDDFGGESDADSDTDLSDDLLAEVDLGNIIPSRTRRRTYHSGLKISEDPVKRDGTDD